MVFLRPPLAEEAVPSRYITSKGISEFIFPKFLFNKEETKDGKKMRLFFFYIINILQFAKMFHLKLLKITLLGVILAVL